MGLAEDMRRAKAEREAEVLKPAPSTRKPANPGTRNPENLGARVPENLSSRVPKNSGARGPQPSESALRSHPDYFGMKVYVRKDTHRRAKMRLMAAGKANLSELVEELLQEWLYGGDSAKELR